MATQINTLLSINSSTYTSEIVHEDFFGVNFSHHLQRLDFYYAQQLKTLGVDTLRYPGGSETEYQFDLANPDATFNENNNRNVVPISDFLSFCKENDIKPIIVIPTQIYKDNLEEGMQLLSRYVSDLTSGVYGEVPIHAFEIGNEYFVDSPVGLTADEYGRIASNFAVEIKSSSFYEVPVSVQAGYSKNDNDIIVSYFDTDSKKNSVDMISIHNYGFSFDGIEDRTDDKASRSEAWEVSLGRPVKIYMSEWNHKSIKTQEYDEEIFIYGLGSASTILKIVKESLEAGVDMATLWPLNNTVRASLSDLNSADLSINGEMFRMLERSFTGAQIVESSFVSDNNDLDIVVVEDETKVVLFVYMRGNQGENYDINLDINLDSATLSSFSSAWAEQLTTLDNPEKYSSKPEIIKFVPDISIINENTVNVDLEFRTHLDIVKLTFNKMIISDKDMDFFGSHSDDYFVSGGGDDTFDSGGGNDRVVSAGGDDVVYSGDGNDHVRSGEGMDRVYLGGGSDIGFGGKNRDAISGGKGSDYISGGKGHDLLKGGDHSDELRGRKGDDVLLGGEGDDLLYGGQGRDELNGGRGSDVLVGGAGADTFVFSSNSGSDTIVDFESGLDVVRVEIDEVYFDSLNVVQVSQMEYVVTISDTVSVRFENIEFVLSAENFVFVGSSRPTEGLNLVGDRLSNVIKGGNGDDIIDGMGGVDRILSYKGDDRILAGEGGDYVRSGPGDDVVYGEGGADIIFGGKGNDYLRGGWRDDYLNGGPGDDKLVGDQNKDVLVGGKGNDYLLGGEDSDVFVFEFGDGQDRISVFVSGEDKIEIYGSTWEEVHVRQIVDSTYVIEYGESDVIQIDDVRGMISEMDFNFIEI